MIKKATEDISGAPMDNESEQDLRSSLASLGFSGTIGFDPRDPHVMNMHMMITLSGVLM